MSDEDDIKKASSTLFKRAFFGVAIAILILMLFIGPSLSGTTSYSSCVKYHPYYDRRGRRICAEYKDNPVSAKTNIIWYVIAPVIAGLIVGSIASCATYPSTCPRRQSRYRHRNSGVSIYI